MDLPRINPPELFTRAHKRVTSLSPTRSPTRQRITDDIFSDLSPATTLEAFTSPSGKLRASVEAATPSERAFGIRATTASKKIQEWVAELSTWPWPSKAGSEGFELPAAKRRRISADERKPRLGYQDANAGEDEYIGSLLAEHVMRYENRIDDIHEDMDDLNVEEIKSTVLNTHFSPKSRPSSSGSNASFPSLSSSYTRMDDFTAVVTATVLQALPNLSRLTRLLDVWTVRLLVLRKVPPLLLDLDAAEIALKSGWQMVEAPRRNHGETGGEKDEALDRKTFEGLRNVLQNKVTTLGKSLDYMLDTLEGRQDTLPEAWLDRMEIIEKDYGEWVVRGDRKVRAGEWAKMARAREAEADRIRAEDELREATRLQAEKERETEEKLRLDQEEALRLESQKAAVELARKLEEERIVAEETARREAERLRLENEERIRLEQEAAAQAARQAEFDRRQKEARMVEEERARQEAEELRLNAEEQTRLKEEAAAAELARKQEEDRIKAEETFRREAERQQIEDLERMRLKQETAARLARQTELARERDQDALRLKERQAVADVAATNTLKVEELKVQDKTSKAAELSRQQTIDDVDAEYPEISREDNISTPESTMAKVEPDAIPSASAVALGIGAAVTGAFLLSRNGDAKDRESCLPHEAPPSRLDNKEDPAHGVFSDPTKVETPNLPAAATKQHPSPSTPVPVGSLSSSSSILKLAPFDGSEETSASSPETHTALRPHTQVHLESARTSDMSAVASSPYAPSTSQRPETPNTDNYSEIVSTPPTPSTPRGPVTPIALFPRSAQLADSVLHPQEKDGLNKLSRPDGFKAGFGYLPFRTSPQTTTHDVRPEYSGSPQRPPFFETPGPVNESVTAPTEAFIPISSPSTTSPSSPPAPLRPPVREQTDEEWIVVEPPAKEDRQRNFPPPGGSTEALDTDDNCSFKAHGRNISLVSEYSISDPPPEIQDAKAAELFHPMLSPSKNADADAKQSTSSPTSPLSDDTKREEKLSSLDGDEPALVIPAEISTDRVEDGGAGLINHKPQLLQSSNPESTSNIALEAPPSILKDSEPQRISQPGIARKTSVARINSPIRRIDIPRRKSTASDISTMLNGQAGDAPSSPLTTCCPLSELATDDPSPDVDDESPSKGRVRSRVNAPPNRRMSGLPPPSPTMSPRHASHLPKSPYPKTELAPQDPEAPIFDNIDISAASVLSSPKKSSDDQIQAQISSLLESIPARIRLTSEPDIAPFLSSDTLRPAKTRPSISPSLRSHSSLSMRSSTPSFTLAPAYGKGTSRPRPQNSNPEIKLYHLSRSTGEAPIKLFVRLVGENGERVMVRVGGGWADLGEYLREYASHHGRRSAVDSDKVEVQDIRPRISSTSSSASLSATSRGNGRSSPTSRPGSAFDRPMSSLHIRKTRRSVGEVDSKTFTIRNPSNPVPMTNRGREFETPPPERIRSSSRLSWTEEEGGLGLAGPKAKKVAISERDQEWVESMKEKVRLASAEKDKKEAKDREGNGFGEMSKIGGTKRLFRKG